jgi:hypothetical protein
MKIQVGVSVATILRAAVWRAVIAATPALKALPPAEARELRIPMVDALVRKLDRWVNRDHLLRVEFNVTAPSEQKVPWDVEFARVLEVGK